MATRTTSRRSDRTARRPAPKPFSVDHFRRYARKLVLDSGEPWDPDDWQLEFVGDVFAGFQQVWLIVPQGNGKTTLLGGLALYHCDFTLAPWVPVAAAASKQARILYEAAKGFVDRSPMLFDRFNPQSGYLRIQSVANGGWGIQIYSADKDTGQGIQPTLAIVDEGHAQRDMGLYRTWRGKLRKRGGQIVMISTAGTPGTDFEETRDRIRDDADSRERLGPARLRASSRRIVLHEFKVPSAKDARDLDLVHAANPLSTITREELADLLEDPTLDWGEDWLRQTCNIPARSSQAAITDAEWDAAETDRRIPEGQPIDLGIDLAFTHDTTAMVPLWMESPDFRLIGEPAILVPPRDGTSLSPLELHEAFDQINARNPVRRVVMDRAKAEEFAFWLENDRGLGVEGVVMRGKTAVPASEDYEAFMDGLREGKLWHTGSHELRRHAMNAVASRLPGDKRRFDRPSTARTKSKQDTRVIDALDAAAMVHYVALANFRTRGPSRALVFH